MDDPIALLKDILLISEFCFILQELLVDLLYYFDEGGIYCARDYAERKAIPRCQVTNGPFFWFWTFFVDISDNSLKLVGT